jgi:putative ubiquitin-RnfH superfamily antitoxin RatB of RatAB toxin-antitoxin module
MTVTVVWATPRVQDAVTLTLPAGATVATAITLSGLLVAHKIDSAGTRAGLHGRLVRDDTPLRDGDRVEICRPLLVDPKEARRLRAGVSKPARTRGPRAR